MRKPARTDLGLSDRGARGSETTACVWDPVVRMFHWTLVGSFALAWLTSDGQDGWLHHWAGYAAASLVLVRLVWGLVGPRYARFWHFVRHPREVVAYLSDIAGAREARHLGHNPAGGAMVVVLMAMMLGTAVSGWMETTDAYFGVAWVEHLHSGFAHGLLILVAVHVAGVALASYRHRENLVAAMVTGRKRVAEPGDID